MATSRHRNYSVGFCSIFGICSDGNTDERNYEPSSHTAPTVYADATYSILSDTGVNGTHYTLSAICSGCSSWVRNTGTKTLDPNSGFRAAWAQNTQAGSVAQPTDPASSFNYHQYHGYFDADFGSAKVPDVQFQAAAAMTIDTAPMAAAAVPQSLG